MTRARRAQLPTTQRTEQGGGGTLLAYTARRDNATLIRHTHTHTYTRVFILSSRIFSAAARFLAGLLRNTLAAAVHYHRAREYLHTFTPPLLRFYTCTHNAFSLFCLTTGTRTVLLFYLKTRTSKCPYRGSIFHHKRTTETTTLLC